MLLSRLIVSIFSVSVTGLFTGIAFGQDFPNKPIRIITTAAGGGSDFTVRIIGPGITAALGQPVVVDNRPQPFIAADAVAKAAPDGYTYLVTGSSLWVLPLLKKQPYEVSDLAPVALLERSVNLVAVNPSVPVKSIKELIALAKAKPGTLNYSSDVAGGRAHLAAELFNSSAGTKMVHVPYKGNAPAITALIAGEVQVMFTDVALLMPHVKAGKLRALAVTSLGPSTMAPGMPTVAETGLPGYESAGMTGMWAPVKTPATAMNRISQEVSRFLARPDVKEKFLAAGVETVGTTPEQFAAIIKADTAKWDKVIKEVGIKID
jgi:tripartite-type tricarboxylate transporter receptor subunit TctC